MTPTATIISKVWNYCNMLRDDGVGYGDYLEQLTYLLFLKMADEYSRQPYSRDIGIPRKYNWQSLCSKRGAELEAHYIETLRELGLKKGMLGQIFTKSQNKIQDPAKLYKIIQMIDGEQWVTMGSDVKGIIYEGLQANFTIMGDFTGDGRVNLDDFMKLTSCWLQIAPDDPWIDINNDDVVDVLDLATFSGQWLNIEYVKIHDFPLGIDPQWAMQGEWAFGQPAGAGGVSYGNPDPTNGYTGDNVYGVNLNGDYSTSVGGPYYLTTGPLDCTGYYNIILKFARWLNTEAPGYVASKIEASSNGTDWNVVWENTGSSSITDDSWQLKEYNISSTADNQSTVYLRWSYEVEDSRANPYSGWNIDDIQLWGNDFRLPEFNLDVEPSGWTTEGQWSFGQPSGGGGAYGNPDPCSGYEGENVFGVNLSGDYSTAVGGPYYLTTGSIDCSGFHNIGLRFARWLNTDAPGYVASRVEASNNGTDWNIIWQHTGSSDITDSDWQLVEYDMSSVADSQEAVYVRWGYEIIDSHAYPYSGWNIDEIRITGDR